MLVACCISNYPSTRSKSWQGKPVPATSSTNGESPSNFVSRRTASGLIKAGVTSHCLGILRSLLDYWKAKAAEESSCAVKVGSTLLKVQPPYPPPDMSPFFLKQYVKSRHDVFEAYPQLLTEMALRLPYQASLCRGIWTHHLKKAQCLRRPLFSRPRG